MPYLILQRKAGVGVPAVNLVGGASSEPSPGTTDLTFYATGRVGVGMGGTTFIAPWWTTAPQAGIGASYQIRATLNSGPTPTAGNLNTWTDLTTDQTWTLTDVIAAGPTELLIEIRDTATGTVQDSGTYTLQLT